MTIPSRRATALQERVCEANLELNRRGLLTYTWGNVSGIDRGAGLVAIKPSGVPYKELTPRRIVLIDLEGRTIDDNSLRPSSDAATHLELYRSFPKIGGVAHSHSLHATAFSQARCPIPCLGTTHADHFAGDVPVTRLLEREEVENEYEANTGRVIAEVFRDLDPMTLPAVLVAGHGPFTWGKTPDEAVLNSVVLERIAQMAAVTEGLVPETPRLPEWVRARHFTRKHGPGAYYGQSIRGGTSNLSRKSGNGH